MLRLTALLLLSLLIAERTGACECLSLPICDRIKASDVIFIGEVIDGGLDPSESEWSGRPKSATLRVVEAFRGIPANVATVTVTLRYIRGMCSPGAYRRGAQTLVLQSRNERGDFHDGLCGPSRFVKDVPSEVRAVRDYFGTRREALGSFCR